MKTIDLSKSGPGQFRRTRSRLFELIWMIFEVIFVSNPLQISSALRVAVLRLFGAKIGKKGFFRNFHIKFPWNFEAGDHCWIGERVWIHNQDQVTIGRNVALSQEVYITTGSHDIHRTMDLVTKPVRIEDGAWLTSRCIVTMGVVIGSNTVVTPGSVVYKSLEPGWVCGGNPVTFLRYRWTAEHREPPPPEFDPLHESH